MRVWRSRLEHGLLLGLAVILVGGAIIGAIFIEWARNNYGGLERQHESILALTLIGIGFQIVFASFFLSVLRLRGREQVEQRPLPSDLAGEPKSGDVAAEPARHRAP
jgi:hypothetical protein